MINLEETTGTVTLINGRLALTVATRPAYNPTQLCDTASGRVFADADYEWAGGQPVLLGAPVLATAADGTGTATFHLHLGDLKITHTFTLPGDEPEVIVETLTLRNGGAQLLVTAAFAAGFGRRVRAGDDTRLCELPYRHHPETGERRDWTVAELLRTESWYSPVRSPIYNRQISPAYGAEAWAWYGAGTALLVAKYNADALEWSVLAPAAERTSLRFGGAARWKLGDPEGAAQLGPGASFNFGATRYHLLDGGWEAAAAAYRRDNERKGHRVPANYNPPVHWNELYDNPYWWRVVAVPWHEDRPELRAALYDLAHMQVEIDQAHALGCECFYMDPGWDTDFGSSLWDAARLGSQAAFAQRLRDEYGLALALHTPLAPWSNNASYPPAARQRGADGQPRSDLCVASAQYMQLKIERLRALCRDGAYFLMFDGSWYDQPCYDPAHGHTVPSTRQAHVDAILQIAQGVHAAYPNVVIEQHDPIIGPGTPRYTPTYFMHAKPGAFDELWAFEFMLDALDDLRSRRAFALYDYNLAYSLPMYIHIDLRTDNAQAVGFWWFASTCRHLGVGGQHPDPAVWAAHRAAMQAYLAHKRFFTQGVFYGLDETAHAHTLAEAGACVLNVFNLTDAPVVRTLRFTLAEVGLAGGAAQVIGAEGRMDGEAVVLTVSIPAMGHQLVEIHL